MKQPLIKKTGSALTLLLLMVAFACAESNSSHTGTLLVPIQVPLIFQGQPAGSVTLPKGTVVKILREDSSSFLISTTSGEVSVRKSQVQPSPAATHSATPTSTPVQEATNKAPAPTGDDPSSANQPVVKGSSLPRENVDPDATRTLLTSAPWKFAVEKKWSIVHNFKEDGSFNSVGIAQSGHWQISEDIVTMTYTDGHQDIIHLPLDPRAGIGISASGATMTVTRVGENPGEPAPATEPAPNDPLPSINWCERASSKGNLDALIQLGDIYGTGAGVPIDASKSIEYYEKAIEKGGVKIERQVAEKVAKQNATTFDIAFGGAKISVERWGRGPIGIVFFSNSGDMAGNIRSSILKYRSLWTGEYSFFLWSYPAKTHPFDQIGDAMTTWDLKSKGVNVDTVLAPREDGSLGKLRTGKVIFTGVASSILGEIQKATGIKKYLLVGDSLGSGIILWDAHELQANRDLTFLIISPTEPFSPSSLPDLQNTVLIANEEGDPWVKSKTMSKWIAANKSTNTGITFASGHLLLGDNLPDDDLCKLILIAAKPTKP